MEFCPSHSFSFVDNPIQSTANRDTSSQHDKSDDGSFDSGLPQVVAFNTFKPIVSNKDLWNDVNISSRASAYIWCNANSIIFTAVGFWRALWFGAVVSWEVFVIGVEPAFFATVYALSCIGTAVVASKTNGIQKW